MKIIKNNVKLKQANHWSLERDEHLASHQETSDANSDFLNVFIQETHFNLVLKMMHFYDLLAIGNESSNVYQKVTNVLKFIGWNYEGINEHFLQFFKDIDIDVNEIDLPREVIRCIFKSWIEKVSSNPILLLKCFAIFDHDSDGYLSKGEICQILYITTEKQRIDFLDEIVLKLDGIYYKKELGLDFSSDIQVKIEKKKKVQLQEKVQKKASFKLKFCSKINFLFIAVCVFKLLLIIPFFIIFSNYLDGYL